LAESLEETAVGGEARLDDDDLLARTKQRDAQAFGELWRRHVIAARVFARTMVPTDVVDDVVSEAFVACWSALARGRGPGDHFRTYLFRAVRTRSSRHLTKAAREVPVDEFRDSDQVMAGLGVSDSDAAARVSQAFYALPPRYRKVLLFAEVEGLSGAEIGERLEMKPNAVYQLVYRAKTRLFEEYGRIAIEGSPGLPVEERVIPPAEETAAGQRRPPTRLGAAIVAGVAGVGVETLAMAAQAQAFGGIAEVVEPTGMPSFGPPASVAAKAAVIGGSVLVVGAIVAGGGGNRAAPSDPPPAPLVTSSASPTPTPTPSATPTPTQTPWGTPTPTPSATPTPTPSATPTPTPTPTPSETPLPAITVGLVDTGPADTCYPRLAGTALPGSQVAIDTLDGLSLEVTTGPDGIWATERLTSLHPGTRIAYISDPAGAQTSTSVPVSVVVPPSAGVTTTVAGVSVWASGLPGASATVFVDGDRRTSVAFDAGGEARAVLAGLGSGSHQVRLAYAAPGCEGPGVTLSVDV